MWMALAWAALACPCRAAKSPGTRAAKSPRAAVATAPLRSERVYLNLPDSTSCNYLAYLPAGAVRGMLVLVPAFGSPVDCFGPGGRNRSNLPGLLARQGVLTLVPAPTPTGTVWFDRASLDSLEQLVHDALARYRVDPRKVVLGGISVGGTGAVRLAERATADPHLSRIWPAAVFAVDAPLDLSRMWHAARMVMAQPGKGAGVNEAHLLQVRVEQAVGGNPWERQEELARLSAFAAGAGEGGNARFLRQLPVRYYADPDVQWSLAQREASYYQMNVLDGAAFINSLRLLGNDAAELRLCPGRGLRADGSRDPGAWSMVDESELARWLLRLLDI